MGMTRMADTLNDEGESLSQFQFLNFYFMKIDFIRERELLQMLIALSSRKQYHVRKRKKIFCVILIAYLKMLTSPNISLQEANWIFAAEKI